MRRGAALGFPDADGEPQCRTILDRGEGRAAAWLMCNPSRADHLRDDQTAGRVVHHSARLGCPRTLVGNVWAWRTPYPADLWPATVDGRYTTEMHVANLDALAAIGAIADVHLVAFGTVGRRYPRIVEAALEAFAGGRPLYCLGTTADGQPLHPLARGKHAVRNDCEIIRWR